MKRKGKIYVILFLTFLILICNCNAHKIDPKITGIWEGEVQFPGFTYTVVFLISYEKGNLHSDVLFPDQSDKKISATSITYSYPDITLIFDDIKSQFQGAFQNGILIGTWQQAGRTMIIELKKVNTISKSARPQTPKPPYQYDVLEVAFGHDDVHISGTLTSPKDCNSYPVVVLIPGVGSHERDNTFFGHHHFEVIADYLTRKGIAVLRYDERGVGLSTGDRSRATTFDFALDVVAGVEYLKSIPEISEVGLIGHSEGGTIASLVATATPDVSFIIMMGSPGLNGVKYNLQFEESMGRVMGMPEKDLIHKLNFQGKVLSIILEEGCEDTAKDVIEELYRDSYPDLPEDRIKSAIQRFFSPWFKYNITYNPQETLSRVNCPVLALFGEKDVQVPPDRNAEAIKNVSLTSNNKDIEVNIIPDVNHYFQTAKTGNPEEYRLIEETISPKVLEIIYIWIHNNIQ